mmetsp:Transcript_13852/g.60480  ORF Transcript_13852/g.60480 Transcript_13852/m.60480 type:complete len:218 (-) Transcript_13852:378-1031(-)
MGRPSGVPVRVLGLHGTRAAKFGEPVGLHVIFIRRGVPNLRPRGDAPVRLPGIVLRQDGRALPDAPFLAVHANHRLDPALVRSPVLRLLEHLRCELLATPTRRRNLAQSVVHVRRIFRKGVRAVIRDEINEPLELEQLPPPPARGGKVHHVIQGLDRLCRVRAASLRLLAYERPHILRGWTPALLQAFGPVPFVLLGDDRGDVRLGHGDAGARRGGG